MFIDENDVATVMTRKKQHPLSLCQECGLRFLPVNSLWTCFPETWPLMLTPALCLSSGLSSFQTDSKNHFSPLWGFHENLSFFKILCSFSHICLCCDYFSQTTSLWILPFGQNGEADLFEQEPSLGYYVAKIYYPYVHLCICVSFMCVYIYTCLHTQILDLYV